MNLRKKISKTKIFKLVFCSILISIKSMTVKTETTATQKQFKMYIRLSLSIEFNPTLPFEGDENIQNWFLTNATKEKMSEHFEDGKKELCLADKMDGNLRRRDTLSKYLIEVLKLNMAGNRV